MDCEETWNLISAELDAEIAPADRPRLEAHLVECAACRSVRDSFRLQDAGLRRAFIGRRKGAARLAERSIAALRAAGSGSRARRRLVQLALAAAAGFLAAVLAFRPWVEPLPPPVPIAGTPPRDEGPGPGPSSPAASLAARLALATGAVEVLAAAGGSWAALEEGGTIPAGARVRTGPDILCELRLPDGSSVRLNESTEIAYAARRRFDLFRGRLWSSVERDDEPFEVQLPASGAAVTALGTKFDVRHDADETSVIVVEGAARFRIPGDEKVVRRGEKATVKAGAIQKGQQDVLLATNWVHKLMVLKAGDKNPELSERLEDLLASIGSEKLKILYEKEINDLGESCVRPLISFLNSKRSNANSELREKAASILSKLAPRWAVYDLIHLLAHEDPEVRDHAAAALQRLTGKDHGFASREWRKSRTEMEPGYLKWLSWWEDNKALFPRAS